MNKIKQFLFSKQKDSKYKIYKILGIKFKFKNFIRLTEIDLKNKIDEQVDEKIIKIMPQNVLNLVAIHLAEHCNLNCQMCDNFSPVAEKEFADIDILKKDLTRLYELTNGKINEISLTGGEAALHPQLNDVLTMVRTIFTFVNIVLHSNGIIIPSMKEVFWKTCADNNIELVLTKYPINIDLKKIEDMAEKYNVKLTYFNGTETVKTSYHIPFDLEGRQDSCKNFINCFHANNCVYLRNGRMYTCSPAANLRHFNKYFNKNLPDCPENSINIFEVKNMQEIMNFLAKPIPLCQYCYISKRKFDIPWAVSKKDINEWVEA